MASRQFVLRIDAGPGTNRTVKQITDSLTITARDISQGYKLLGEGTVKDAAGQVIGGYRFEDIPEPSPTATAVAQRWQKLKEAIRFQQVLTEKNGDIGRLGGINDAIDIMELIEEGKI